MRQSLQGRLEFRQIEKETLPSISMCTKSAENYRCAQAIRPNSISPRPNPRTIEMIYAAWKVITANIRAYESKACREYKAPLVASLDKTNGGIVRLCCTMAGLIESGSHSQMSSSFATGCLEGSMSLSRVRSAIRSRALSQHCK
jgi:hypothetical protein